MDNSLNTSSNKKADFFKGGYFLITLSAFEAEKKILIPGHRFLPFLNPMVMHWKIKIKAQNNKALKKITEKAKFRTLKPLYSLFGEENILFLLIDDKENNSEIILIDEDYSLHDLYFTAYDLSSLLPAEDTGKKTFSNLVLTLRIDDWDKGIYTASVKAIDKDPANTNEWVSALEHGFKKVFSSKKNIWMVSEVMSNAFMHGGKKLLENPAISLENFFEISEISDIADIILEQKEDPVLTEQKRFIREKTLSLIKIITSWLENSVKDKKANPEATKILEKQILVTKKTLIAVLEEINNPLLTEKTINTIMQIITESEFMISKINNS